MMDENEWIGLGIPNVLGRRSSCHSIMEAEMIVLYSSSWSMERSMRLMLRTVNMGQMEEKSEFQ